MLPKYWMILLFYSAIYQFNLKWIAIDVRSQFVQFRTRFLKNMILLKSKVKLVPHDILRQYIDYEQECSY